MKQKEPFKRINVAELKRNRQVEELIANLQDQIHEEAEKLAQELVDAGYNVDEFELGIETEVIDNKYIATIKVVQVGKVVEYDLGGDK